MFDYFFRGFAKSPVCETFADTDETDKETDEEEEEEKGEDSVVFGDDYFVIVSDHEENELEI